MIRILGASQKNWNVKEEDHQSCGHSWIVFTAESIVLAIVGDNCRRVTLTGSHGTERASNMSPI